MTKVTYTILKSLLLFLFLITLPGCGSDSITDEPAPPKPPQPVLPPTAVDRTVLVYMAADNNLSNYALKDIAEMKTGASCLPGLQGGRLLVYHAAPGTRPRLIEINPDGSETQLATYPEGGSVTIARMRRVIDDTRSAAPARDYGLVLWSHATGWLNDYGVIDDSDLYRQYTPMSFGSDGTDRSKMKIKSLARALDGQHWSFIYFDCCHMATVEVAYELRHLTDIIVASPTELGVEGMPYDINVPYFFKSVPDMKQAARNTFNSYADGLVEKSYGCSISVIDTSVLDELAEITKAVYASGASAPQNYSPIPYFRSIVMSTGIFDMHHHISSLDCDPELKSRWTEAFNKTVTLKMSTPTVYGLKADEFHGLGSNIVNTKAQANVYDYTDTSWWTDVMSVRFNNN